jgi:hypothetical protein
MTTSSFTWEIEYWCMNEYSSSIPCPMLMAWKPQVPSMALMNIFFMEEKISLCLVEGQHPS